MRRLDCQNCHNSFAAATTFIVNGEVFCEPCANEKVVTIQKNKGLLKVTRGVDPTICFKCSADFGDLELPTVAGLYACEPCRDRMVNFQYPTWLKAAAVALLALLVLSLVHGRSYFVAGRAYYKGRKLLDGNQPEQALPYFEQALKVDHPSEITGYAAMAYLKSGHPDEANTIVKGVSFKDDELYRSLQLEFEKLDRATASAKQAAKLYNEKKYKDAAASMQQAAQIYPAFTSFAIQAAMLESFAAFYEGDYATMVQVSESAWKKYPSYDTAATLSGAYSSLYASTGDEAMKEKAVEIMLKVKTLASTKEMQSDLAEWERRFNHRLETRKILTKEQYDALSDAEKQVTPQ